MNIFEATVALTGAALNQINTLMPGVEERLIIIAQGKEFQNGDPSMPWTVPEVFRMSGDERAELTLLDNAGEPFKIGELFPSLRKLAAIPLVDSPDGTFHFLNLEQGVRFVIKLINRKDEFVEALNTPGAHVLYAGHARYGRGPCFGEGGPSKGEMWEEGTGPHPNADGLFRMGFPFIAVPVEEILEHGYTANLAPADVRPKAADCDPGLRSRLSGLKALTLEQIHPELIHQVRDSDPEKKWWTLGPKSHREVVIIAGWENTLSTPDDLGSIDPKCRVFVHMACSTFDHNHPVVRKLKGWKREGNERYAYWTIDLSTFIGDHYWLQHILTYPKFNAFAPLQKSLEYAKERSNALLRKDRFGLRFI